MSWGNIVQNLEETSGTVIFDYTDDEFGDKILEQLNTGTPNFGSYRNTLGTVGTVPYRRLDIHIHSLCSRKLLRLQDKQGRLCDCKAIL